MPSAPDLLIQSATLLDPGGGNQDGDPREADLLIRGGEIAQIGKNLSPENVEPFDAEGLTVSPGWMDMHVHLREPGFEHKETIETGTRAAAAGGFTAVACMPNTDPPLDTRDVVEFVKERAEGQPVAVHPVGGVSKGRDGEALAEMGDLAEGGAVAFSDDGAPVWDAGLMRRALEYSRMLGMPIIGHMEERSLSTGGHMHEGAVSARLGLEAIPSLADDVMIARDVLLAETTGGSLHVAHLSTRGGVELVRRAKARGVPVTAEVCAHHLALTDRAVEETQFSTNTKMHPPLRSPEDVQALKDGLADGTIDALCTDHAPHASFEKEVEFTAAPNGIIGLETAFGLIGRELVAPGVLSLAEAVEKLVAAPRRVLGLPVPRLEEGRPANLTIFDPDERWTVTEHDIRSKSQNTPFLGAELVGRPVAIYNRGRMAVNDELRLAKAA
ncbi:MAG: dihydroorotase [Bacteroidetes bacterium SW_4_67_19]|nr:MAG: dihydroorotase [Bacteroidetes bacterium SW_4_67_19]